MSSSIWEDGVRLRITMLTRRRHWRRRKYVIDWIVHREESLRISTPLIGRLSHFYSEMSCKTQYAASITFSFDCLNITHFSCNAHASSISHKQGSEALLSAPILPSFADDIVHTGRHHRPIHDPSLSTSCSTTAKSGDEMEGTVVPDTVLSARQSIADWKI